MEELTEDQRKLMFLRNVENALYAYACPLDDIEEVAQRIYRDALAFLVQPLKEEIEDLRYEIMESHEYA